MCTHTNFRTKKALKEAVASGTPVTVYQPNPFGFLVAALTDGEQVALEGPHYPEPHRWYATARVSAAGRIIPGSVK
ncbi:MAG: hypothetical protein K2X82_08350 [Gemmataceae bacterium]|nr:hypothetical protein [Gemmataceae bacterium]